MDIIKTPRESTKERPYLSELLNKERIKIGLTQIEFARKLGTGVKTVRKIEQGNLNLNFKTLKYIFNAVGLDLVPQELVSEPIEKKGVLETKKILEVLSHIFPIFKIKYGVSGISLFGSYAKDLQRENSDIDILIDVNRKLSLENEGEIKLILETLLEGKKVDLTLKRNLREEFFKEVMETKIDVKEKL